MNRSCRSCSQQFVVQDADLDLLHLLSPKIGGVTLALPPPQLCPPCRFQRRAAHRNERNLYRTQCEATGQAIISNTSPDKPFAIYKSETWWSDRWDPTSYGREFDFNRPFFEQFCELRERVPRVALVNKNSTNSEFTNHASGNRDCYLSFILFDCEDVFYSRKVFGSRTVCDCTYIFANGEQLYECFWGENLHSCRYCTFCFNSHDLAFCYDCRSCHHCFMSSNLRNGAFVFQNEQLSEKEYRQRISKIYLGSDNNVTRLREEYALLARSAIKPAARLDNCENVVGDLMINSKNCYHCFCSALGEDCRYCTDFDRSSENLGSKSCMDCFGVGASELLYEVQAQANGYHNLFCNLSYWVQNSMYLDMCFNISNCFGCVGLHSHESYCILNRRYSEEEFASLVPRIVEHMGKTGEWGEFFPIESSVFCYNETAAMEHFPLDEASALACGFSWSNYERPETDTTGALPAEKLPDDIADVADEICAQTILCSKSRKPYRITAQELAFYRKMNVALPRLHFDVRHEERNQNRNQFVLDGRMCSSCSKDIFTSWLTRDQLVYCEKCYHDTLY